MPEGLRVDLEGELTGRHILVNRAAITIGFAEDMESRSIKIALDALSGVIVGGDLVAGCDRNGLRALVPEQFQSLIEGITRFVNLPKAG
jgi:hypothetical protein